MGENIEVKDVQKTEYLDKNGLDMLWAKVKENTHNQVEVERNRAVTQETRIIDTKADKSALDNYVLSTTLTEYAKKTDIPEVDTSDFVSKTTTDAQIINSSLGIVGDNKYIQIAEPVVNKDPVIATLSPAMLEFDGRDRYTISTVIRPDKVVVHSNQYDLCLGSNATGCGVSVGYDRKIHSYLDYDSLIIYHYINNERYIGAKLNKEGIFLLDGDNNHVLTSQGSTIDITQYVLKSVYDEKIAELEARIAHLKLIMQKLLNEIKTNVKKDFNV